MAMSEGKTENFLLGVKRVGFISRLLSWKNIVSQADEAYAELMQRMNSMSISIAAAEKDRQERTRLENERQLLEQRITGLQGDLYAKGVSLSEALAQNKSKDENLTEQAGRITTKEVEYKSLLEQKGQIEKKLAELNATEAARQADYAEKIANLNKLYEQLDNDRKSVQATRENEIKERFIRMKETWKVHENNVQQSIVQHCKSHGIEYIDKKNYDLKGNPDNAIKIAEQYVIFDAKSPQGENLDNFPDYIESQFKAVTKYLDDQKVMRYVFLVVPANAIESLRSCVHHGADYSVFIITVDSLEPILLNLKRIEEYEIADVLNPEEKDNIIHAIARLTHLTKRRIEIDAGMTQEAMNALSHCKDLPDDIQDGISKSEKAAVLNPKQERSGKCITDKQLATCAGMIGKANIETSPEESPKQEKGGH